MPCERRALHQLVQKAKSVFDGLFGFQRLVQLVVDDASGVAG